MAAMCDDAYTCYVHVRCSRSAGFWLRHTNGWQPCAAVGPRFTGECSPGFSWIAVLAPVYFGLLWYFQAAVAPDMRSINSDQFAVELDVDDGTTAVSRPSSLSLLTITALWLLLVDVLQDKAQVLSNLGVRTSHCCCLCQPLRCLDVCRGRFVTSAPPVTCRLTASWKR